MCTYINNYIYTYIQHAYTQTFVNFKELVALADSLPQLSDASASAAAERCVYKCILVYLWCVYYKYNPIYGVPTVCLYIYIYIVYNSLDSVSMVCLL